MIFQKTYITVLGSILFVSNAFCQSEEQVQILKQLIKPVGNSRMTSSFDCNHPLALAGCNQIPNQIDISGLSSGTYLATLEYIDALKETKIIVKQ